MSLFSKRWVSYLLTLLIFFRSFTIANAQHSNNDIIQAFFPSSRIFQESPTQGITLLSSERVTNSQLLNGTTDEIILNFVFKPADGVSPTQYTTSFVCNSQTVWDEQSCTIRNAEAAIVGTTEIAQNTTVACEFSNFPGSTECQLVATLQDTTRQAVSRGFDIQSASRQTARYESEVVTINVYGLVFYVPDSEGQLSEDATIVSGESASYKLSNFDRVEQAIRSISTFAFIPGVDATGTSGLQLYSAATTNFDFGDFIFWYDPSCQLTSASFEDGGKLILSEPSTCGVGMAVEDDVSHPKLGVKFRPNKSGKITMRLFWSLFGTSDESYEQILTFDIQETAPPVITAVEKLDYYKSVPCEIEILKVIAYNVRFANTRQVFVLSLDGQSSWVWSEAVDGFRYDEDVDLAELTFESAGGTGQGVTFGLRAIFGDDIRNAVTPDVVDLTLVFSTPVLLTGLNQTVLQVEGGEVLEVSGALQDFGAEDSVYVGSFQMPASDLISFDGEKLIFFSPALDDLGNSFSYPVTVGVCAERSNALTLQYQVAPILSISSPDTSNDETGAYIIKAEEVTTFVAEVTGNNLGAIYEWKLFNSSGEEVSTENATTNSQIFLVQPTMLQSTNELYTLQATVTNSLDLSATEQLEIMRAQIQEDYVLVNVHKVATIKRSVDAATLIQAHVTTDTSLDPTIVLQWTYRETVYNVGNEIFESENGTATSQATGPTRFGLEFFVTREDLVVGSQDISLTASLVANPNISGSDTITLVVVASDLRAVINDGINGTLQLTGSDLFLSGSKSIDPDILPGEGDASEGLTYEWLGCRKSLVSSFTTDVEDCSTILPADRTTENVTVQSVELLSSRLDNGSSLQSTYLSFGLQIRKDIRIAETYIYIELRTVEEPQKIPTLSSLEIVDRKGNTRDRTGLSIFGDIIIQPTSDDELVSWAYDMTLRNQRFLLTQFGTLKNGTGFMPNRGVLSRLPMGFNVGVLEANTEYTVEVTVTASDTDLIYAYDLSFQTAEIPRLTCTPPEEKTGLIQETKFTVSGTLSFETQDIEYCFFLMTETERFVLGDGCSTIPFATFSFYRPGIYNLSCVAKTSNGYIVDSVTITKAINLTTPATTSDEITALLERLTALDAEVTRCEAVYDDACLVSLISVAKDFAVEVDQATTDNDSAESENLREQTKAYIARLAALSDSLAENTVFRPNQVAEAVDLSYNLLLVPTSFITSEETLFSMLRQAEAAIASTQSLVPIASEELVERIRTIGNRTIGAAFEIESGGTTRRRLRSGLTRAALGSVLFTIPRLLAEARAQQAECSFVGEESTSGGGVRLPEIRLGVRIVCDGVEGGISVGDVSAGVCGYAGRTVLSVAQVPGELISATGLVDILVDVGAFVVVKKGDGEVVLGDGCVDLRIISDVALREGHETAVGRLAKEGCDSCLEIVKDNNDVVVVEGDVVRMRTSRTGMFVVGRGIGDITGRGLGGWIALVAVLVAFVVIGGVTVWLGVGVIDDGTYDDGEVFDWEYIERDMWGRETPRKRQSLQPAL